MKNIRQYSPSLKVLLSSKMKIINRVGTSPKEYDIPKAIELRKHYWSITNMENLLSYPLVLIPNQSHSGY
jgi:hypothetical protein